MLETAPLMLENQVKKSQFCVVSPRLLRLGDGGVSLLGKHKVNVEGMGVLAC